MRNGAGTFSQNEWLSLDASYAIAYLMTACFSLTAIWLMAWLLPSWNSAGMVVVCLLISLEAFLASRLVWQVPVFQAQAIYFRITEWLTILVLLKVFTELRPGFDHFLQNIRLWRQDWITYLFTPDYLLNILLTILIWQLGNAFASDLWKLESYQIRREQEGEGGKAVLRLLLRRYLLVGTGMVVLAALTAQDLLGQHRIPAMPWLFPVVALYFLLGLVLLSLTYFFFLRTEWKFEHAQVQNNLASRWIFYSALILASLIGIALVLPTYDSVGLLGVIRYLVGLSISIFAFIFGLIIWLMAAFMKELSSLLGLEKLTPTAAPTPPPIQFNPPASGGASTLNLILSILIWAFFLALIGIAIRQYLRANRELAQELKRRLSWRWLASVWIKVRELFQKASLQATRSVRARIQRLRSSHTASQLQAGWDIGKALRLNPRQRILFYYLTLLRRADEAGTPRREWQTPSEYGQSLSANLPEAKEGVAEITASFEEARYSRHEVSKEKASQIKSIWDRLLRLLRNRRGPHGST